ncbi:hypothetical protein D9611_008410 [Ephemerocybe angulata]|uniref:Uncharacterized protein n=1 Tax=Ephemerocybe angulata TaxID=980116 RepID=A0A8H5F5D5_9AGAR|nr:hypothetical protein D9611_008410 [Tulosesus angulatus]
MVLKRKRGDEWVAVNPRSSPPLAEITSTSTAIPASTSRVPETAVKTTAKRAKREVPNNWTDAALLETTGRTTRSRGRASTAASTTTTSASIPEPRPTPAPAPTPVAIPTATPAAPAPFPMMSMALPAASGPATTQPLAKAPAKKRAATTRKKKAPAAPAATTPTGPSFPIQMSMALDAGASSSMAPAPSAPPKKKAATKGKKKDPNTPVPEKRGAMFKSSCPQNIRERLERVRTQTFYMVDRRRNDGELREEFSVLGSTGNVYTVKIDKLPSCDCPDARKGNHCKHILFILTKVLHVPTTSELWYQKALLTSELESIFANAPAAPNAVTNRRVQEAYARATGKVPATAEAGSSKKDNRKIPGEDDDCPICYETMFGVKEDKLVFCEDCGNALHSGCFAQWRATSSNTGKELTCVWCRSKWALQAQSQAQGAGGSKLIKSTYLNLAGAVGLSPARDTSSYYHGPRRGAGWGPRYLD